MTSKKSSGCTLPSSLTIRNIGAVNELLQKATTTASLNLKADGVEEITSPGLQLLAVYWQHAKNHHHAFHLTNPSAPLKQALSGAGLSYLLD